LFSLCDVLFFKSDCKGTTFFQLYQIF